MMSHCSGVGAFRRCGHIRSFTSSTSNSWHHVHSDYHWTNRNVTCLRMRSYVIVRVTLVWHYFKWSRLCRRATGNGRRECRSLEPNRCVMPLVDIGTSRVSWTCWKIAIELACVILARRCINPLASIWTFQHTSSLPYFHDPTMFATASIPRTCQLIFDMWTNLPFSVQLPYLL